MKVETPHSHSLVVPDFHVLVGVRPLEGGGSGLLPCRETTHLIFPKHDPWDWHVICLHLGG